MMLYLVQLMVLGLLNPVYTVPKRSLTKGDIIYKHIKRIHPKLDNNYAKKLSRVISTSAQTHKVPSRILTAILMQESAFKLDAVNKRSKDYGIAQINKHNINYYGMSKERLVKDLDYSVDKGALVLSHFYRKFALNEPDTWYCRYNTGYRNNKIKCEKYLRYVWRYL